MASTPSLPVEILLQIFEDESITATELGRCAQACWLFHNIAATCKINYNFPVDHISQSAWKLIRRLQENPELGQRFQKITVTWHRRRTRKPETWADKWRWTGPNERTGLAERCNAFQIKFGHIPGGMNSEALLPLLLTFTPNLESLDYGDPMFEIMYPSFSPREGIRAWEYCQGDRYSQWNSGTRRNDSWAYFGATGGIESPRKLSWLYTALDDGANLNFHLPGLSNLKEFSHGYRKDNHYNDWPAKYLALIMLLPQLETVKICRCSTLGEQGVVPLSQDPIFSTRRSRIKRLELSNCIFREDDYKTLAGFTGSLEIFRCISDEIPIVHRNKAYNTPRYRWKISPQKIAWFFMDRNQKTLARDQVSITINSLQIVPESEADFGPDDDPFYYDSPEEEEERIQRKRRQWGQLI